MKPKHLASEARSFKWDIKMESILGFWCVVFCEGLFVGCFWCFVIFLFVFFVASPPPHPVRGC